MAVTERDALGATGRATGVQDQRDVVRARRTRLADRASASLRRKRDRSLIVEGMSPIVWRQPKPRRFDARADEPGRPPDDKTGERHDSS